MDSEKNSIKWQNNWLKVMIKKLMGSMEIFIGLEMIKDLNHKHQVLQLNNQKVKRKQKEMDF